MIFRALTPVLIVVSAGVLVKPNVPLHALHHQHRTARMFAFRDVYNGQTLRAGVDHAAPVALASCA